MLATLAYPSSNQVVVPIEKSSRAYLQPAQNQLDMSRTQGLCCLCVNPGYHSYAQPLFGVTLHRG